MAEKIYKASLTRSQKRQAWSMIFRHPIKKDADGKNGLRIHRGLGTSDEAEAQLLIDQINEILNDESMWSYEGKRIAEKQYDARVIDAFYDSLIPTLRDFRLERDSIIKLPGVDEGYLRVLLVGTTGAGKTTVIRQLIGTDPKKERFPSTSAAKTTTSETEIILTEPDSEFRAVVSFLPQEQVRMSIEECVFEAILAHHENKPREEVVRKLLEHSDQRFRLSYILGNLASEKEELSDEGEAEEIEDEEQDEDVIEEQQKLVNKLKGYLNLLTNMADSASDELAQKLDYAPENSNNPSDKEAFQALFEDEVKHQEAFEELVDNLLDEVESRFDLLADKPIRNRAGWPLYWEYRSLEREEFIRVVRRFSSNHAKEFGKLLTPIVQGIRIAGPFKPNWYEVNYPKLVLIDGEGLGHNPESASTISTQITIRYNDSDVVLLVDNAAQPMQAAPISVLKSLASSGNTSKLVVCFTHFDEVKGVNLPNTNAKKNHIRTSVDNAIVGVGKELGLRAEKELTKVVVNRIFYLSNIQSHLSETAKLTLAEFNQMFELFISWRKLTESRSDSDSIELALINPIPIYDDATLVLGLQKAMQLFRDGWHARLGFPSRSNLRKRHWAAIKAFNRRMASGQNEYDDMRPVAELISALSHYISNFLYEPFSWEPATTSEEQKQEIISEIKKEVYSKLHAFSQNQLLTEQYQSWLKAFEQSGRGSTYSRARDIESIYDQAAPILDDSTGPQVVDFVQKVRTLVRESILNNQGRLLNATIPAFPSGR